MATAGLTLFIDLEPGAHIDLVTVAEAQIAWATMIKTLGHVDKWRIQRRIDVMSMKPRKLSAVLS